MENLLFLGVSILNHFLVFEIDHNTFLLYEFKVVSHLLLQGRMVYMCTIATMDSPTVVPRTLTELRLGGVNLTLLNSDWPKLGRVLAVLSAVG